MTSAIKLAPRRSLGQRGQELLMFGCMVLLVYMPLLLWMFVMGMSMVVSIQTNNLARDLDNMFIHGTDFSTYGAQQLALQLTNGLGLTLTAFGTGNTNQSTTNSGAGNGLVWVTQIMYVGAATDPLCKSLASGTTCTNANSFVYTKQVIFGNTTLTSQKNTSLGTYTGPACVASTSTSCLTSAGLTTDPLTDANAKLNGAYQTSMVNQWQTTSNGQTSLVDGQVVYVVEAFFQTPQLSLGTFYNSPGTYARYFF